MIIIWVVSAILLLSFGLIILIGAPYVPTLQKDLDNIFVKLKLKKGSQVIDLGSGDGRVLITAARHGYVAIGYELNPILWLISYMRTKKYNTVKVYLKNLWQADLSKADAVFIFSAQPYLTRLSRKFDSQMKVNSQIISYGFRLPAKKPSQKIGACFIYSVK